MIDALPLAVRGYAVASDNPRRSAKTTGAKQRQRARSRDPARRPRSILVYDTETSTGPAQPLLFGCYRFYRVRWAKAGPTLSCLEEGLFHADDLAESDPAGLASLARYASSHRPATDARLEDSVAELRLLTRTEFANGRLWKALSGQATVVMFNAPFDLSRLALDWGEARRSRFEGRTTGFEGGFSLTVFSYEQDGRLLKHSYRPRVLFRSFDSLRARLGLGATRRRSDPDVALRARGSFLDLRQLAYGLTSAPHSLESASAAFDLGYRKRAVEHGQISNNSIAYCREDVDATARLYQALTGEYEQHQLQPAPTRVYSPASLAKAYLREAGIRPLRARQPDFPRELLGYALVAYYGGRAECRIRRVPVPVSYLDFASMYPTVCCLLGLWRFMVCERVEVQEEDPATVQRWLDGVTLEDAFNPDTWKQLPVLVQVQPQGDVLPIRAHYSLGGGYGIGVNPLTCGEPLWYALPDLLAARLLDEKAPRVLRAVRLVPAAEAEGVSRLRIRGSRPIDPLHEDLYQALVEERRRQEVAATRDSLRTAAALKTVASAASYGLSVELNRQDPRADPTPVDVYGLSDFHTSIAAVEEAGEFFFPPLAALVTAAARLMLALLERLVTDAGGSYAFCDTDSMTIVSSRRGGFVPCPGGPHRVPTTAECVRALSWAQLDQITERFAPLNPYDRTLVPTILELEEENFSADGNRRELTCYAISAKRYCLYTLDRHREPQLVKRSEHALGGFYLNPTDPESDDRNWVDQVWRWILQDPLDLPTEEPGWLDRPALTRFTASHPRLLKPFAAMNKGRPYREQMKPANFLLVAHIAPGGHPRGADPKRFTLIAPYNPDPNRWLQLPWRNIHDPAGRTYRLNTETIYRRAGHPLAADVVGVLTYRSVLAAYRVHAEPKSLGPDGRPCGRSTIGLLSRRPVQALSITHIGKEANLLDEIQAGLIGDEDQTLTEYLDHRLDPFVCLVLPILRELPLAQLARDTGLDPTTIKRIRSRAVQPSTTSRELLTRHAGTYARKQLGLLAPGRKPDRDDLTACARYLAVRAARVCPACGKPPGGPRATYCSRACRDRAYRSRC